MENLIQASLMQLLVGMVGLAVTGLKSIAFVEEGSRGLKLRFGKVVRKNGAPMVIEPGFLFMIPFVESLQRRHVRQQEVTLREQTITLKSGLTFKVAGVLYFKVNNVYKALFEIEGLDRSLEQLAMGVLRDEVAKHNNHEDMSRTAEIAKQIFEAIKQRSDDWGVELIDFRLTTCAPTSESAHIVNLHAATKMRTTIIKATAGDLNVSPEQLIQSGMAAIMIGAPLVASAQLNTAQRVTVTAPVKKDGE